jgi:uncharacterized protein (UPF0335 family)
MPKPRTLTPSIGHNSIDKTKLKELVERIERIEEERSSLGEDVRSIYSEAKSAGLDVKALRQVVKLRRQDQEKRTALQEMIDEYMAALGMLQGTPLGEYAM